MSVAEMLVIGAIPVLCFALGYLCGAVRSCRAASAPSQEPVNLRRSR